MTITREIRKNRTKKKITGEFPVVYVYRTNKNLTLQLVDVLSGKTVYSLSSVDITSGNKTEKSISIGTQFAAKLKELDITRVVVNRNGFIYHGRIKASIEAIKAEGITI